MTLSAASITTAFQVATLGGFALTAVRLYSSGLFRKYRIFFAYLIFSALQSGICLSLDVRSGAYLRFFILSEPLIWFFYVMVVLELCSLVLDKYRGLYSLGRWVLYGSVAISICLSVLTFYIRTPGQLSRLLPYYFVIERGVVCALLIFLFLILVLLSRLPVRLSRNVVVHSLVYSVFFLVNTLGLLLRSVLGLPVSTWLSTVQIGITALCVLVWLFFLDPKGEARLVM